MADAEKALWQAVLLNACQDATITIGPEPELKAGADDKQVKRHQMRVSQHKSRVLQKREAVSWLEGGSKDFRDVCDMAGFDPNFIATAWASGRITRDSLKSKEAA